MKRFFKILQRLNFLSRLYLNLSKCVDFLSHLLDLFTRLRLDSTKHLKIIIKTNLTWSPNISSCVKKIAFTHYIHIRIGIGCGTQITMHFEEGEEQRIILPAHCQQQICQSPTWTESDVTFCFSSRIPGFTCSFGDTYVGRTDWRLSQRKSDIFRSGWSNRCGRT